MSYIAYQWINTDQQLADICRQARLHKVIALDTEFIRTRTYYAKLGLIQMYDGHNAYLIDPLAIQNFSPFIDLLADTDVLKILHAASEDLDVFWHYFNQLPTPMIDTQIMAGFAGVGVSIGFAKLVQHYLDITLDKGASRTDWLARPLTETQLQYAVADVWYLIDIYNKLFEALDQTPWRSAVEEECVSLCVKVQKAIEPNKAYKEISNAWQLSSSQLAVLQILAKWRIEEAQKRDVALNFVVKEQSLWQLAKSQPKHTSTLLEFMHPNEVRIHGKKLLWLIEQGKAVEPRDYPTQIERLIDIPGYKQTLFMLQETLEHIQPTNLAPELLASKRQLNQLFLWHYHGENETQLPELLRGWRRVYGEKLLACLLGDNYDTI